MHQIELDQIQYFQQLHLPEAAEVEVQVVILQDLQYQEEPVDQGVEVDKMVMSLVVQEILPLLIQLKAQMEELLQLVVMVQEQVEVLYQQVYQELDQEIQLLVVMEVL